MKAMNFLNTANDTPTNCEMSWPQIIKFNLGFKNSVINEVMNTFDLDKCKFKYLGTTEVNI
tara:strand:+ start:128 stop:310 length:183 start_codon:yes stop_codon:yes gene_type:complete